MIVDDSPLMRDILADLLADEAGMEVVGLAENGSVAVRLARELKPDVISMDIKMPVMDGFEAIETIMSENPRPILVVTDFESSKTAFMAISKGAIEVYPKRNICEKDAGEFAARIRVLSKVRVIRHIKFTPRISAAPKLDAAQTPDIPASADGKNGKYNIVAIASSTGGPKALATMLSEFKTDCPVPIVVAQHMDDGFVDSFIEWLDSCLTLKAKVGVNGESLRPGMVYFAPPHKHIKVSPAKRLMVIDRLPGDIYHPSCNLLLSSVGEVYGNGGIGVILTGMGEDGVKGLGVIKNKGGMTIAQDEQSSIVFGMPAVAAAKGYADSVLPLAEIGKAVDRALHFPDIGRGAGK